jgi:hypothetical protein
MELGLGLCICSLYEHLCYEVIVLGSVYVP